jgi:hypothetical protein
MAHLAGAEMRDISLVMTIYPKYHYLVPESIYALQKYWPGYPDLLAGYSQDMEVAPRLLADLERAGTEFVVNMHEDFWLTQPVKQDLFNLCLKTMQDDPGITSCSLTWEPSNVGIYHFPKALYGSDARFQVLDSEWNYTINLQMRIWRREHLMGILATIPRGITNAELEPAMTRAWRNLFPSKRCLTYAFPNPPKVNTFTDSTDKSAWIIGYDNIMHACQRHHYKYPVYINNRDRLTSTRGLVDYLHQIPDAYPIIVDNGSTYPPLMEWYDTQPTNVIFLNNLGPWAPWTLNKIERERDFYVVTDSDLDLTGVPLDVLDHLRQGLEDNPKCLKAGLSLRIDDLPDTIHSKIIQEWEQRFWAKEIDGWYHVDTDTTFAMYRARTPVLPNGRVDVRPAIRADYPYTASHIPWYQQDTDEERYFFEHANANWSTWSGWDGTLDQRPAYKHFLKAMGKL